MRGWRGVEDTPVVTAPQRREGYDASTHSMATRSEKGEMDERERDQEPVKASRDTKCAK
jgi:hypothetical protein